jgi:hypothetical protein
MGQCDMCGNDYDKAFEVLAGGRQPAVFDSFECAMLRPLRSRCRCGGAA